MKVKFGYDTIQHNPTYMKPTIADVKQMFELKYYILQLPEVIMPNSDLPWLKS